MQRMTRDVAGSPMVAWREAGRGPPVVCVHGAGISSREFRPLLEALGPHLDAWSVDLPGFGAGRGPKRPLGLRALADALAEWLTAAGLEQVVLLGCSFGCQIAVDLAARFPERVTALVLVGPTVDPAARGFLRQALRWARNAPQERASMAPLNLADYRNAGPRRLVGVFAESLSDRVEDKLPHVCAPTLVVRGARDRLVPQEWAEEVTRLLPAGRLAVVPESGHMVPYRRPRALAALVRYFLAQDQVTAARARAGGRAAARRAAR
ncbi:alpha/beta fold hydrolase [Streptomyces sp. NPDC020192]|uniref:alpha/beta fold hydrolase n=1 Tax=Streptomyces sp. NPDC020192 TaxID=3365066 RepID=UPI0037BD2DB0